MSLGLRGGLIGTAIGLSLPAVVELVDGVGDIDATGWISRASGLFSRRRSLVGLPTGLILGDSAPWLQPKDVSAWRNEPDVRLTAWRSVIRYSGILRLPSG